ncbi:AraC family transcriptional regulator N-terminal domain-containing protein [Burkholderia sp. PU8-34]
MRRPARVVIVDMTVPLCDALNRLLALLDAPDALPVLAPYTEREICCLLPTSD